MCTMRVCTRTLLPASLRHLSVVASTLAKAALLGANTVKAVFTSSVPRVVTSSAAVRSSTRVLKSVLPVAMPTTVRDVDGGSRTLSMTCTTPLLACTILESGKH